MLQSVQWNSVEAWKYYKLLCDFRTWAMSFFLTAPPFVCLEYSFGFNDRIYFR